MALNIEQLPNEILLKIIEQLEPAEILKCSLLSWKWFNLINNYSAIMRKLPLRLKEKRLDTIRDGYSFLRKYREVSMIRINTSQIPSSLVSCFSHVESLSFSGCSFDSLATFEHLLNCCKNLKNVSLAHAKLQKDSPTEAVKRVVPPPTTISIECFHLYCSDLSSRDEWEFIKELKAIPLKVKTIDLRFEVSRYSSYAEIAEMLTYIQKNYATNLKKIEMYIGYQPHYNRVVEFLCGMSDLQLESLTMPGCSDDGLFTRLLERQPHLKHFALNSSLTRRQLATIESNLVGLTYFDLKFHGFQELVYLNQTIAKLKRLRVLHLHINVRDIQSFEMVLPTNIAELHLSSYQCQLKFLPTSTKLDALEKLVLGGLDLKKETLQFVFKFMPNLRHFELYMCHRNLTADDFCASGEPPVSLANLKHLQYLGLDPAMVNDRMLMEISASDLRCFELQMDWGGVELPITEMGLNHLALACPLLPGIKCAPGGDFIYKRKTNATFFEKCAITELDFIYDTFFSAVIGNFR